MSRSATKLRMYLQRVSAFSTFILTFEVWASSTNFTICDSVVSWPTWVASTNKDPFWLMVPPITESPGFLMTGMDSPVIRDSSAVDVPWRTLQSTGILAPGTTLWNKMYNANLNFELQHHLRVFQKVQNVARKYRSTNIPSQWNANKRVMHCLRGFWWLQIFLDFADTLGKLRFKFVFDWTFST